MDVIQQHHNNRPPMSLPLQQFQENLEEEKQSSNGDGASRFYKDSNRKQSQAN